MKTLERLNDVLRPENLAAIDQTLANLRELTANLNKRVIELDSTLTTITRAAGDLGTASRHVTTFVDGANQELRPALRQADRTLQDISAAVKTLEQRAERLSASVGGTVQDTGDQLAATAVELRATSDMLGRVLERLQDPRAALLGPDSDQRGPGE